MSNIERLVAFRHQALRYFLVGFVVWMGSNIAREMIPTYPMNRVLLIVGLIGWGVWMVGIWNMYRLQKAVQENRHAIQALNDEGVQADRAQAAFTSVVAISILNAALVLLSTFFPTLLSGSVVAQLNILTVTAAFIGAFLRRDSVSLPEGESHG